MLKESGVQGVVLSELEKSGKKTHIYTTNGFRVNGKIVASDQYTVLMEDDSGEQNLVYKHAISTVNIPKGLKFAFTKAAEEEAAASSEK